MSLKKTWFSYVLWVLLAGITVLITYSILTDLLQGLYSILCSYVPEYAFGLFCGAKILLVIAVVLAVLLLRLICSRIEVPAVPKWLGITGHILIFLGIIVGFCMLRYPAFVQAYFWQSYSHAPSAQLQHFFELSKVGAVAENGFTTGTMSVLEQAYVYVLHTLFLFFGNKAEILYFLQLVLQALNLALLMVIGHTLQKGVCAWIPALLYAVLPTFFYTASDVGISNFWIFVVVFGIFVICLLEKAWKNKNITYLVVVTALVLFAGVVFCTKMDVLLDDGMPFASGGIMPGVTGVLNIETFVLSVFLLIYCVTFFLDKQEHGALFIFPMLCFGTLFVWLSFYEYEAFYCMMLLTWVCLFFMVSQSARILFRTKAEVVTGKNKAVEPAKFEWTEMKEVMHSTEGIEVRKEEPVKVELPITEITVEEKKEETIVESSEAVVLIDKKAPIENVLPMPKKHKPKVLDYAFEPSEDMMHYDVEIENDEYDY